MAKYKKGEKHDPGKIGKKKQGELTQQGGKTTRVIALVLFVFSFLVYSNTLQHDFALDDDVVFKNNRFAQQGIDGIPDIFAHGFLYGFNQRNNQSYRPLITTVFALEHEFFGTDAHTGHLINVLLYGLTVVLLFLLLAQLFKQSPIWMPALMAAVFAAHPIHTEVVANIKGRDDILTCLFMALAFWFFMRHLAQGKPLHMAMGLLSYFACLLTKESAVALIAVFPLLAYFFAHQSWISAFRSSALYVLPLGLYLLIRGMVLDDVVFGEELEVINNGLMAATNAMDMYATNFVILGKYLWLLIFPHPLSFDYSFSHFPIVGWTDIQAIGSLLVYIGLGVYALMGLKRRDVLSFSVLFYLITLSVTSNLFVKIGCTLGERFLFVPSLAYCIALVVIVERLMKKISGPSQLMRNVVMVICLALVPFVWKTYDRNKDWKDNITLFSADVDAVPNSARAHFSLASALNNSAPMEPDPAKKGSMLNRAIAGFHTTIDIYPEFTAAWYNMGVAYYTLGDEANAQASYERAIELNPKDKQALNNMGVIYFNKKEYANALAFFKRAVEADPSFPDPYANIGAAYHNQRDYTNAITYYLKALSIQPRNRGVLSNLSKAYNNIGETEKANYYANLAKQ